MKHKNYNIQGIYKITNIVNKKIYIGSAINIRKRKNVHFCHLRKNKHHSKYLQNSYNKHGKDNFIFEILELVFDKHKLLEIEQYYLDTLLFSQEFIKKENNKFRELGYNMYPIAGSKIGTFHSNETKEKIRNKLKGISINVGKNNPMYGKLGDNNPKIISVIKFDLNNIFIKEYASIITASKENNIPSTNIIKNCKNKLKTCGGFIWKYKV